MKTPQYQSFTLIEFQERFGSEEACREHMIRKRWPDGYTCPCGSKLSHYKPSRREFQCYKCNKVQSVTAGTLMHRSKVPLRKWFWFIYLLATSKKAVSTLYLSQQLKLSYPTAMAMRFKIQKAMSNRDAQWKISGIIEADEIFIGGKQTHEERRKNPNKTAFFLAVEEDKIGRPKFVVAEQIEAYDDRSLRSVAEKHIPEHSTLKTDGQRVYPGLAQDKSSVHEQVIAMNDPQLAAEHLTTGSISLPRI